VLAIIVKLAHAKLVALLLWITIDLLPKKLAELGLAEKIEIGVPVKGFFSRPSICSWVK
jgi:hypothetical protein